MRGLDVGVFAAQPGQLAIGHGVDVVGDGLAVRHRRDDQGARIAAVRAATDVVDGLRKQGVDLFLQRLHGRLEPGGGPGVALQPDAENFPGAVIEHHLAPVVEAFDIDKGLLCPLTAGQVVCKQRVPALVRRAHIQRPMVVERDRGKPLVGQAIAVVQLVPLRRVRWPVPNGASSFENRHGDARPVLGVQ
jgi:hypothetical protein